MVWSQFYGGTVGSDFSYLAPVPLGSTHVAVVFPTLGGFGSYYLGYLGLAEELPVGDSGGNVEVMSEEFEIWYNRTSFAIDPTVQYTAYMFAPARIVLYPNYVQLFAFDPTT